jgi:hypothetical protein
VTQENSLHWFNVETLCRKQKETAFSVTKRKSIYIYDVKISGFTRSSIYRVSHELRSLLREGVPYVKLYQYNPKHLYQKLNGYGDNGHRKCGFLWGRRTVRRPWRHTRPLRMPGNESLLCTAVSARYLWRHKITDSCGLRKVLINLKTNTTVVREFL